MWSNETMVEHGWDGAWGWFMGLHFLVWVLAFVLLVGLAEATAPALR